MHLSLLNYTGFIIYLSCLLKNSLVKLRPYWVDKDIEGKICADGFGFIFFFVSIYFIILIN